MIETLNFRIFFKTTVLLLFVCKTVHLQDSARNGVTTENTQPCEENWILFGQNCYKAVQELVTWSEASAQCNGEGAHLVSIHSQEEQDFITGFLIPEVNGEIWIGLHDTTNEDNFVWTDGSNVNYTFWHPGQPNNPANPNLPEEDCGHILYKRYGFTAGRWNDHGCSERKYYVCKKQMHQQDSARNGVKKEHTIPCEENWIYFGQNCYKAVQELVTWSEASAQCNGMGAHLVSIHSQEEQDFITGFLIPQVKGEIWIGLHDTANEDTFVWTDGSNVNYTFWHTGQPNNPANPNLPEEDCGHMLYKRLGFTSGRWNDHGCSERKYYVCEKQRNESLSSPDPFFCTLEKGGGWKYQGVCYNLVNKKKSWKDAEQYCRDNYKGHLVTISDSETDWFVNYILKNFKDFVWIGIKLRNQLQQRWVSGWHVTYNILPSRFNSKYTEGECVLNTRSKTWVEVPCHQDFPFLCESSKEKAILLKNPLKGSKCPEISKDWRDLDGEYCYYFDMASYISWFEANRECIRRGGLLASIRSQDESDILHPFVADTHTRIFFGLNALLTGGITYMWPDGTQLNYTNWNAGEPNGEDEICGEILSHTMQWNDVSCDERKGFICSARKVPNENSPENVESQTFGNSFCTMT